MAALCQRATLGGDVEQQQEPQQQRQQQQQQQRQWRRRRSRLVTCLPRDRLPCWDARVAGECAKCRAQRAALRRVGDREAEARREAELRRRSSSAGAASAASAAASAAVSVAAARARAVWSFVVGGFWA
jgi:hypothetical protein